MMKRNVWIASLVLLLVLSLFANGMFFYREQSSKPTPENISGLYQSCLSNLNGVDSELGNFLNTQDEKQKRLALYRAVLRANELKNQANKVNALVMERYGEDVAGLSRESQKIFETDSSLLGDYLNETDVTVKIRELKEQTKMLMGKLDKTSLVDKDSVSNVASILDEKTPAVN